MTQVITIDTTRDVQSYHIQEDTQQSYFLRCLPDTNKHSISLFFYLARHASVRLDMLVINTNATITIQCIMQGESSNAIISGVYLLRDAHEVTINTMQHHNASYATSNVAIKGVLYDASRFTYSGMIRVEQEACGSNALQENKNIVLSDMARAVSAPQLEVLTNDVHCFHASAVGTFDQEQLLYAYARGLDKQQAESLLLQGFFADMINDNDKKEYLEHYL